MERGRGTWSGHEVEKEEEGEEKGRGGGQSTGNHDGEFVVNGRMSLLESSGLAELSRSWN